MLQHIKPRCKADGERHFIILVEIMVRTILVDARDEQALLAFGVVPR